MAMQESVGALSGQTAALSAGTQPNHHYPNQHPEEDEVMEEEEEDDGLKEKNGCPFAVNMARR